MKRSVGVHQVFHAEQESLRQHNWLPATELLLHPPAQCQSLHLSLWAGVLHSQFFTNGEGYQNGWELKQLEDEKMLRTGFDQPQQETFHGGSSEKV